MRIIVIQEIKTILLEEINFKQFWLRTFVGIKFNDNERVIRFLTFFFSVDYILSNQWERKKNQS